MAAYHKVEVSLNTNAVEVGIPSPQTVNVVVPTIGPAGPTGSVGPAGPTGPQGVPGTGLEVLTTQGDLLYQGASTGQRLAIGTSGQVLKVANGIPAWGNESGAVTSVNGETGAVSLSAADVTAAAASHTHDGTDVFLTDDEAYGPVLAQSFAEGRNGIYWPTDLTINSKPVYKLNRTYGMFFENLRWHIFENSAITANIVSSSADDQEDFPHQTTWSGGNVQRANVANFGTLASQQFQFVGDVQRVGTSSGLPLKTGSGGAVEAGAFGTGAGQFAEGSDPRFSDSRQPTLHGSTHHTGGTDALAPSDIGAQSIFARSEADVPVSGPLQLSAARAAIVSVRNARSEARDVYLPMTSIQNGDIIVVVGGGTLTNPINIKVPAAGGAAIVDPNGGAVTISVTGQQYRFIVDGVGNFVPWTRVNVDTHTHVVADVTGAAASGSITASGLTQATARILGRTTASTGAVEEITIGTGLSLSAGELSATGGSGGGEVRSDFVSPYTYTGLADAGTSESTASWTIRRSEFDAGGSFVATLTASAVAWNNRLTASYA
jgi:hypothetical protein